MIRRAWQWVDEEVLGYRLFVFATFGVGFLDACAMDNGRPSVISEMLSIW